MSCIASVFQDTAKAVSFEVLVDLVPMTATESNLHAVIADPGVSTQRMHDKYM